MHLGAVVVMQGAGAVVAEGGDLFGLLQEGAWESEPVGGGARVEGEVPG